MVGYMYPPEKIDKIRKDNIKKQEAEKMSKEEQIGVKPLNGRVIIKQAEKVTQTESGLHLPEESRERPLEGTVVAVSEGQRLESGTLIKPEVAVGNRVLFGKYSGNEIRIDGEEYVLLRQEDILVIITGNTAAELKAADFKAPK